MNKLKAERDKAHLTQKDVAVKAGISERQYQYYESGARVPSAITAVKIAKVLNTTVEVLYS